MILQIDGIKDIVENANKLSTFPQWFVLISKDLLTYGTIIFAILKGCDILYRLIVTHYSSKKDIMITIERDKSISAEKLEVILAQRELYNKEIEIFKDHLMVLDHAIESDLMTKDQFDKWLIEFKETLSDVRKQIEKVRSLYEILFTKLIK